MNNNKQKIDRSRRILLLTGGNGLIGRSIREHSLANNWSIIAPTRQELDLMDYRAVSGFLEKLKPETIIHAAGLVGGIKANIAKPVSFLDANLNMGRNVLMAARCCGTPNFINLGSTCMYPKQTNGDLSEDKLMKGKLEPTNEPYAIAKLFTTKLCQYINKESANRNFKTLIPCNIYGKFDNFLPETSHLIPAIIQKIHAAKLENHRTVVIWGDGTARREFMYASDLAEAILLAAADIKRIPDIMNLGLGKDYSVNEYYMLIAKILKWEGSFKHDLTMPVGMARKLCDIKKQKAWGWFAPTPLSVGIDKTYRYYMETLL